MPLTKVSLLKAATSPLLKGLGQWITLEVRLHGTCTSLIVPSWEVHVLTCSSMGSHHNINISVPVNNGMTTRAEVIFVWQAWGAFGLPPEAEANYLPSKKVKEGPGAGSIGKMPREIKIQVAVLIWTHSVIGWGFTLLQNWIPTILASLGMTNLGSVGIVSALPWVVRPLPNLPPIFRMQDCPWNLLNLWGDIYCTKDCKNDLSLLPFRLQSKFVAINHCLHSKCSDIITLSHSSSSTCRQLQGYPWSGVLSLIGCTRSKAGPLLRSGGCARILLRWVSTR